MKTYCETGFVVPPEAGVIIDEFREQAGVSTEVFIFQCVEVGLMCAEQYLDNRAQSYDTVLIWAMPDTAATSWEFLSFDTQIDADPEDTPSMFDIVDPFCQTPDRFYMLADKMAEIQPVIDALDVSLTNFMQRAIELRIGLLRSQNDGGTLLVSNGAEDYWSFASKS